MATLAPAEGTAPLENGAARAAAGERQARGEEVVPELRAWI